MKEITLVLVGIFILSASNTSARTDSPYDPKYDCESVGGGNNSDWPLSCTCVEPGIAFNGSFIPDGLIYCDIGVADNDLCNYDMHCRGSLLGPDVANSNPPERVSREK